MSTQVNQYFMYGICLPYNWHKEWESETGKDFHDTFDEFMQDNAFERKVNHKEGIFCLFDGRDGRYIIIGRVLEKSDDDFRYLGSNKPITIPNLTDIEKEYIQNSVKKYFNLDKEFNFYFVTHYV